MDKLARSDWKRRSVPYDFSFDRTIDTDYKSSVSEVFDQAMETFIDTASNARYATIDRARKKSIPAKLCVFNTETTELSTDQYTPGVLKVFGETILPGVQYKSVLASCRSTAQELVKQALERFGLPVAEYRKFVLCDVVGRYENEFSVNNCDLADDSCKTGKWDRVYVRLLSDRDKPLLLQKFWKPIDGYSRRYELHERAMVTDCTDDDDTSGINKNARKILMSKLRPGAIPLFDPANLKCHTNGLNADYSLVLRSDAKFNSDSNPKSEMSPSVERSVADDNHVMCSDEADTAIPTKHPFFMNIRGFDIHKDKTMYVIKWKQFTFGNPNLQTNQSRDDVPKFNIFAPDVENTHCNFKVYKFKKSNGTRDILDERNNYFLEVEPLVDNVSVNGHKVQGKMLMKSGDILGIGIYYVLLFKDCSKGFDIPLSIPWLPVVDLMRNSDSESETGDLKLNLRNADDESKSNTDDSMESSVTERMSFCYPKDKEDELVKYVCAIIQQQNTCQMYALTTAFMFSMCIEHASRNFERRQLKHLFLRILFTVRENVAETAKSLSTSKFTCSLLDTSLPPTERDQKLQRLLLWKSNCVQLLLFLKHTFQLPELPISERGNGKGRSEKSPRKDDSAKHALGQLVTGLEEIIMFCFQQSVYTITKSLHPVLQALLDSNPFSDANSEYSSMEDIIRMFTALAEVTHAVMLHESITRQLFTYLFFFTNTNVFNKLIVEVSGKQYYNWQCGVRIRANLSQLEDWATQNGLEDEFGQMFERLLAASELLATSKNTLVKYHWQMMKTHYQPLSPGQLYHLLTNYQLGTKVLPPIWTPPQDELEDIEGAHRTLVPLSDHPPFALPDNCGVIDLIRTPEDTSFWNHLRRLKALYGVAEDDSDSGFSLSNTPRGSTIISKSEMGEPFYEQETNEEPTTKPTNERRGSNPDSAVAMLIEKQKSRIPVKKCNTNPWSFKVPKSGTGVCKCASFSKELNSERDSVAMDLMKEEQRYSLDSFETTKDSSDKLIATLQSKSIKINPCLSTNKIKRQTETSEKQTTKRYTKNGDTGVANCSAHVRSRSYACDMDTDLPRGRSNSTGVAKHPKIVGKNLAEVQSYSMEDISSNLQMRLLKYKPSASFEEAIQKGYHSDTKCNANVEHLSPLVENNTTSAHELKRNGPMRQHTRDSVLSDDVFVDEYTIDNLYSSHINKCDSKTLPNPKSFKSGSVASNLMMQKQRMVRKPSQKMMTMSFDSDSHSSSIELTKDELIVSSVDEVYEDETCHVPGEAETQSVEVFPAELLTEVSEHTLAALKRHGSSLNVAPSCDNSPREQFSQVVDHTSQFDVTVSDDKKQMAPCPLFTVYLKKGETGLGLGLIDGLHTPLRLAGIYIRKILPDSPASQNGCLQVGDRVLAVSGKSVIGADYSSTMNAIKQAGDTLTLLVARGNESMATKVSAVQL